MTAPTPKANDYQYQSVDWYHQRVVLCHDSLLQGVLAHNRDEEIEHACMALEWLRRKMPGWDEQLRTYLFKEGPIEDEDEASDGAEPAGRRANDLGVGSLRPIEPAGKED